MKNTSSDTKTKSKHSNILKGVIIVASVCLFAAGAYFLIDSRGSFVQSQIRTTISGPEQIEGGQTEQFDIVIKNTSNIPIDVGKVTVTLSESLKFSDDNTTEKIFEGAEVTPGDEFKKSVSVTSVQSEEQAFIKVRADYSPQDLSVQFITQDSYDLIIGSLDADVNVRVPEIAFVGEQVKGVIAITPYTSFEKQDLYMLLTTTGDFDIVASSPQFADKDRLRWSLDRFRSGVTQEFSFTGVSESANDVSVSVEIGRYEGLVFRPLSFHKSDISISHIPLLVLVESKSDTTSVVSQQTSNFDAVVSNKGDTDLKNITIDIELPTQVMQDDSFTTKEQEFELTKSDSVARVGYESSDVLKTLAPGEEQTVQFGFKLKDFASLSPAVDKKHDIKVVARGVTNNGNSISNSYTTEIVLEGTTKLSQKVLRNSSLLQGQGPLPPVVGQATSYIVVWELENDINSVDRAKVEAVIPDYVEYRGVVRPADQNLEYDTTQNVIRWDIGEFAESKRTIDFEVWVTPSQDHAGRQIPILDTTIFTAENTATKGFISNRLSTVSTVLPDDDNISLFEGIVEEP